MNRALLGGLLEAADASSWRAQLEPAGGWCCVILEREAPSAD
jgi:hypothetical protein